MNIEVRRHTPRPTPPPWRSIAILIRTTPVDSTEAVNERKKVLVAILREELRLKPHQLRVAFRFRYGYAIHIHVYRGEGSDADHRLYQAWETTVHRWAYASEAQLLARFRRVKDKIDHG